MAARSAFARLRLEMHPTARSIPASTRSRKMSPLPAEPITSPMSTASKPCRSAGRLAFFLPACNTVDHFHATDPQESRPQQYAEGQPPFEPRVERDTADSGDQKNGAERDVALSGGPSVMTFVDLIV